MQVDLICICGHSKDQHQVELTWGKWEGYCSMSSGSRMAHTCIFKLDNLRYLEECFEKSKQ